MEFACRSQRGVDKASVFERVIPIDVGHAAQTGDDVAHGYVRSTLPPMNFSNGRVDRHTLGEKSFVEPGQGGGDCRVLITQPVCKLHREGVAERRALIWRIRCTDRLWLAPGHPEQPIGKRIGLLARQSVDDGLHRETA